MDAILGNVATTFGNALDTLTNSTLLKDFFNSPVWNNYYYIIVGVVAIFLIYKLISIPFRFVLNGILGCVMLIGVNWVGALVNFSVPVNIITALIAGVFGIPGIVGIIVYYVFFPGV